MYVYIFFFIKKYIILQQDKKLHILTAYFKIFFYFSLIENYSYSCAYMILFVKFEVLIFFFSKTSYLNYKILEWFFFYIHLLWKVIIF